jgi:hypothetical protein
MFRTIFQVIGISLTLVSAMILSRGNLTLTPESIVELQTSYAGYHPAMIDNLCGQYADNRTGIFLLCLSIVFQFIGMWPTTNDGGDSWKRFIVALITFLVVGGLAWTISNMVAKRIQNNIKTKVERLFHPVVPENSLKGAVK